LKIMNMPDSDRRLLSGRRRLLVAVSSLAASTICTSPARAADDKVPSVLGQRLRSRWEAIKFAEPVGDKQTALMKALGNEADADASQNPHQVDVLIWDGIITSERAGMAGPFSALGLAKRARAILERAYEMDPAALDAEATVSLGVLYYRTPGFPISFGNNTKARSLLEQGVRIAPTGLDALYFYGDFLYSQGELTQAAAVLKQALKVPGDPSRPLWDYNRREVAKELLAKIAARS
jgi:tetratricopeptide (TPR) repeat protein